MKEIKYKKCIICNKGYRLDKITNECIDCSVEHNKYCIKCDENECLECDGNR